MFSHTRTYPFCVIQMRECPSALLPPLPPCCRSPSEEFGTKPTGSYPVLREHSYIYNYTFFWSKKSS